MTRKYMLSLLADDTQILQIESDVKLLVDDELGGEKIIGQVDVLVGEQMLHLYVGKALCQSGRIQVIQTTYQE